MDHIKVDDSKRVVGYKSVVGMALAVMIGSVLILPGPGVDITGSSLFLAICASGVCILPAALSMSEMATALPVSGGEYVFLAKAFGPMVGTIAGIGLWFTVITKGSFGLAGFVSYILPLVGSLEEWQEKVMGIGILILITALNLAGTKKLKVIQKWATLTGFVVLIIVTLVSFKDFDRKVFNEEPLFLNGAGGFIEATAFVYIGYAGLKKVAALASEIKKPGKTLPKAILTSLFVMTPFFAVATLAMSGIIKTKYLKKDYAPFHTLAEETLGKVMSSIVAVLCIVSMVSMANVSLVAISRFPYAMARDGLLPKTIGLVWKKTNAPWVSILIASGVMAICILFLPIKRIAKLGSSFMLICDSMTNASCMVYRSHMEGSQKWYRPKFYSPFYPWTPIFGIITELVMLSFLGYEGLFAVLAIVGLGAGIYLLYGRSHARFNGVMSLDKKLGIGPTNVKPLTHDELEETHKHHHAIVVTAHELDEEIATHHVCAEKFGQSRGDARCPGCDALHVVPSTELTTAVCPVEIPTDLGSLGKNELIDLVQALAAAGGGKGEPPVLEVTKGPEVFEMTRVQTPRGDQLFSI